MFQDLKTYLLFRNRFCGIEHSSKKGDDVIYGCILKIQKNEITSEKSFEQEHIQDLLPNLSKQTAVYLVVNNDHVLTKKIENTEKEAERLAQNAYPNINLNEFVYEVIIQETVQFISICRRSYIENIISEYEKKGISVVYVSIGNSLVKSISGFIESDIFYTSNARVSKSMQGIQAIKKDDICKENYDINGLLTNNYHILSIAAALSSIIKGDGIVSSFQLEQQKLLEVFKQKRFFTQFLKYGLVILLSLSLINVILFSYYHSKVGKQQQVMVIDQNLKEKVVKLNAKVDKTQKMVEDMLEGSSSRSSFYFDAIVQSLPSTILLSELNYQPLQKQVKSDQSIVVDSNTILISGNSNDSKTFSNWITLMEQARWVKKVEIIDYSDISVSESNFTLKFSLHNDL